MKRSAALVFGVLALIGTPRCSQEAPTPSQVTDKGTLVEETATGNVTLYVSNQSYVLSPVDITVSLDGKPLLRSEFHVVDQHNYVRYNFDWPAGPHILRATSEKGVASAEAVIEVSGKRWGFVGYWYDPEREPDKKFTIIFQDQPIGFR